MPKLTLTSFLVLTCVGLLMDALPVVAQAPQVLTGLPQDRRLEPLKDLDGYFPFEPPTDRQAWVERKETLRRQVRIALGLFPEPKRTPLNAVVHGRVDLGDYTVEKVYFESMPGFYVTGSLYRPAKVSGKVPGVLCPHGHWANGRFYDAGKENAEALVKQGGESDIEAARNHIQARCVHLARMGCIAFQYDMIGYADSQQISQQLAHGFARQRPEYNREPGWGFFSPQAELNLQSIMGLQTWNSIRALDFLESLPEIDAKRLAVTGASGGGTQTFLLAALDDRVQVSFPAVMVSTAMQGGCTCENCSLLRVTTGNVELAGLFAPRPQGVTAANDWTKEMSTKGYPQLKQLYELLGAPDNLTLVDRTEFGHNYNQVSRTAFYELLNQHFDLNASVEERPFRRLTAEELTVWNEEHPRPETSPDFERELLQWWKEETDRQMSAMKSEPRMLSQFLRQAYQGILQRELPRPADVTYETTYKREFQDHFVIGGPVRNRVHGEEFPALFVHPKKWDGEVIVVTGDRGKDVLYDEQGNLHGWVIELIRSGKSVVSADLLYQGEFVDGEPPTQTRRVKNPREAAAYTFGYNHTLFARRTHDLVNLLTLLANHEREPQRITLVGKGKTGALLAAALTLQPTDKVTRLLITPESQQALAVDQIHATYFLPGAGRYLGVEGMVLASGIKTSVVAADQPLKLTD